jgi:hypothetical protein
LAVLMQYRMARLRAEGLVDRSILPTGRTDLGVVPHRVRRAVHLEWPEMRGHRSSRTVSDVTAVPLKTGHTLTGPWKWPQAFS